MRISKRLIFSLVCFICIVSSAHAEIGMRALGDSLMAFTGFSKVWCPMVRVKQMRISDNDVTIYTNGTLHDFRWTPENVAELKRKVSMWTLDNEDGNVVIYTKDTDIETLITDCAAGIFTPTGKAKDLTNRHIALCPSHGIYYNAERKEWIWQRATLWTTVEDLYSQEYVRHIRKMLENAGATIYSPRADLDQVEVGPSGMPKWAEGARYWLKSKRVSSSIWNLYEDNDYKDDIKCRGLWVNSLKAPIDLCLAFHTDGLDSGNDSTIVGTLVIYTAKDDDGHKTLRDGRDREQTNRNLADWIQTQITSDLQHWTPDWTRRQLREANYCESRVPEVPSIILELLSHKNMADMKYGLDPKFRFAASRAVYKGILRYLNGPNAVVQPLPVEQISISLDGTLRWEKRLDPLEPTAKPTYYLVYVQANDGEWDVQQVKKATSVKLDMQRGVKYNYYVVAGNDGGLSYPSPVVSAYLSERDEMPTALVIDAFDDCYGPEWFSESAYAGIVPGTYACEDGFSCAYIGQQWDYIRTNKWLNDDNCGWGSCYRDHAGQITVGNTHDYAVQHGRVLRKMRISYVSCTEQFAQPDSIYQFVDVICGRQRQPLGDSLRAHLSQYMDNGGRLLLSTDRFSSFDREWTLQYFHATYYAANATRSGRVKSPRHRMYHLMLEPNEEQLFTCHPEGLKPEGEDALVMATYEDMRCPAAVGNNNPEAKTLVYGFPLEAIQDFDKIYQHAVKWLIE